ncbi:biotin/lipoyl-containing protein, partial [Escherichia coli]
MAVTEILSPLPGVFYRKPAPDSAPFLENGDTVQESTVIGLIEIMKQFNE